MCCKVVRAVYKNTSVKRRNSAHRLRQYTTTHPLSCGIFPRDYETKKSHCEKRTTLRRKSIQTRRGIKQKYLHISNHHYFITLTTMRLESPNTGIFLSYFQKNEQKSELFMNWFLLLSTYTCTLTRSHHLNSDHRNPKGGQKYIRNAGINTKTAPEAVQPKRKWTTFASSSHISFSRMQVWLHLKLSADESTRDKR